MKRPYPGSTDLQKALNVVGAKWALPVLEYLQTNGTTRFVEIQRGLTPENDKGISTEQLRTVLALMTEEGLLTKTRLREVPPRVNYEVTSKGWALAPAIQMLGQWGKGLAREEEKR